MASNSIRLLPPASSGSFGFDLSINGYEINESWDVGSNTSTIYLETTLKSFGNAAFSGSAKNTLELWLYDDNEYQNGVQVSSSIVTSLGKNKSTSINANYTLKHKNDGSLSVKLLAKWNKIGTNQWSPVSGSTETSFFQCYTIPRASSLSLSDFYVEDGTTIRINSASSNFTHTLYYQYEGKDKKLINSNIRTEYYWKPDSEEFYGYITNSNLQGKLVVFCETYNGGTKIGDNSSVCTVKMKEYEPNLSLDYIKDINPETLNLTGNENKLILGQSTVEIKSTYSTKTGASILYYIVKNDYTTISDNPGTIDSPRSSSFIISVTDTRNRTKTIKVNMSVQEYVPLEFKKFEAVRPEATSSKINISFTLAYYNGNFGLVQNTIGGNTTENKGTIKLKYRESSTDEWTNLDDIIIDIPADSNSVQYSTQLQGDFSYQKAYYFEISTFDKLKPAGWTYYVTQGVPLIDKGETFVDVHGELTADTMCANELKIRDKLSGGYSKSLFPTEDYEGNVDNLTTIGIYRVALNATNKPSDAKGLCMVIGDFGLEANDRFTFYQLFFSYDRNIYYRSSDPNSFNIFGDWYKIRYSVG